MSELKGEDDRKLDRADCLRQLCRFVEVLQKKVLVDVDQKIFHILLMFCDSVGLYKIIEPFCA